MTENRRISTPEVPQTTKPKISPYRSLRSERNGRKLSSTRFADIPESDDSDSPVEKRSYRSDRASRKSSTTDSLKKVRLDVENKNKKNSLNTLSSDVEKKDKVRVFDRSQSLRSTTSAQNPVQSKNGYDNPSFNGSNTTIDMTQSSSSITSLPVYREQYWTWPFKCSCQNWTRREKILFSIVAVLTIILCGLVGIIGFLAEKEKEDNSKNGSGRSWYTWKL